MPRKFDQDAKDRVVRLVEDRILAENMSMQAACQAVAPKLGVSWHTARQWTQQARRAGNIPEPVPGPDPRKVDTSGVSYAALVSVAEFSASKTSGAERLHQECRRRVL